jgi:hypothetical protein
MSRNKAVFARIPQPSMDDVRAAQTYANINRMDYNLALRIIQQANILAKDPRNRQIPIKEIREAVKDSMKDEILADTKERIERERIQKNREDRMRGPGRRAKTRGRTRGKGRGRTQRRGQKRA